MDDTSKTEEQLLSLMRSLSVRIRKAEKERDCAVRQLKQLKSILDGFSPEFARKDPERPASPRPKRRSPVLKKTPKVLTEALVRHELSENRAYDSGLASSLTNGFEHTHDVNEEKSGRSSMTSEHGDSGSLEIATQEDSFVRTPIKVVNHKMLDLNAGHRGSVFPERHNVTSKDLASKTLLQAKHYGFEGLPDSITNRPYSSSTKAGDDFTHVGSLESRIEAPIVRDSLRQSSSTGVTDPIPLTKSFLHSLTASSVTLGTGERASGTRQIQKQDTKARHFDRKLTTSNVSPSPDQKRRSKSVTKTMFLTRCQPSQQPLAHMPQGQWYNLTPFPSDPPRAHTPAVTSLAPFSGPDACRCPFHEENTRSPSEFRYHATTDEVQMSGAVKHESPKKVDKQTSTRSSSGVMSRSWLRKLIYRLEELSDNFQPLSPAHSSVVRFDCDPNYSGCTQTRSSSCSPSRGRTTADKRYLTVRRNSSPASTSAAPRNSRISQSMRSRVTNKRSPSCSGVCSQTAYPIFVPIDRTPCKLRRIRSRTLDRTSTRTKSSAPRLGAVTKRKPSMFKRSPSKARKSNTLASEMRPTPRPRSEVEMPHVPSPRIRIFDPNGEPHDSSSGSFSPIQIHRVHDVPRLKVASRLSWN